MTTKAQRQIIVVLIGLALIGAWLWPKHKVKTIEVSLPVTNNPTDARLPRKGHSPRSAVAVTPGESLSIPDQCSRLYTVYRAIEDAGRPQPGKS